MQNGFRELHNLMQFAENKTRKNENFLLFVDEELIPLYVSETGFVDFSDPEIEPVISRREDITETADCTKRLLKLTGFDRKTSRLEMNKDQYGSIITVTSADNITDGIMLLPPNEARAYFLDFYREYFKATFNQRFAPYDINERHKAPGITTHERKMFEAGFIPFLLLPHNSVYREPFFDLFAYLQSGLNLTTNFTYAYHKTTQEKLKIFGYTMFWIKKSEVMNILSENAKTLQIDNFFQLLGEVNNLYEAKKRDFMNRPFSKATITSLATTANLSTIRGEATTLKNNFIPDEELMLKNMAGIDFENESTVTYLDSLTETRATLDGFLSQIEEPIFVARVEDLFEGTTSKLEDDMQEKQVGSITDSLADSNKIVDNILIDKDLASW